MTMRTAIPHEFRFWMSVDISGPDNCWPWMRAADKKTGYGVTDKTESGTHAHRAAYHYAHGGIPAGLHVLHSCDNRICCNPRHLSVGTNLDNMRDRNAKGRQAKPKGELHGQSKLTVDDVRAIRRDQRSVTLLGKKYGVSYSTIIDIQKRKSWSHV